MEGTESKDDIEDVADVLSNGVVKSEVSVSVGGSGHGGGVENFTNVVKVTSDEEELLKDVT